MKFLTASGLILVLLASAAGVKAQDPIMYWDFETNENRTTIEVISGSADTLEGNFEEAAGISGKGIRLDGFTTRIIKSSKSVTAPGDEFTVEAWIALGNYPWNWCPVITTESPFVAGYRLMIGPLGQVSLETAIDDQWISCSSARDVLPLRKWIHIAGVYKANDELTLYVNGEQVASNPIQGNIRYSRNTNLIIGMVADEGKPSDLHRTWGTVKAFYGIDGIIDEIKVTDKALSPEQVSSKFNSVSIAEADIAPRRMPTIDKHPGQFGAFYTRLKYYPGWDNLWPVEQDPDVVVTFEKSPVKLMFWRGIRYGASWVSENENWMTDQSVEAWEHGDKDREGCFEHMQDRHCRFSHVRIIENTEARVVVHWRYALVSAYNNTWRPDPKTGWECWIDEYYYIYPDATGIRRVSWKKGSLGYPRQFQESLPLLHPGQAMSDVVHKEFAYVADYDNNTNMELFVEDRNKPPYGPFSWDDTHSYTIQQYNFKSDNKPFICFEPGNVMNLRHMPLDQYNEPGGCNHFPVGQARCDGRTTRTSDRPSHFGGFPISDPVIHEERDRYYWNGLYGMNEMDLSELVHFGRSWAYAPELIPDGEGFLSSGYDKSRRCYQIENIAGNQKPIEFTLAADEESPVMNPAFFIKNWQSDRVRVLVNGDEIKDYESGLINRLDETNLAIFLWLEEDENVSIRIVPE